MADFINKDMPVYFTYSRNDDKIPGCEHIADVVETLKDAFVKEHIQYSIDKENLKPGGKITDYENEIGKSECVVLVFSEKYFKSLHCMYEFMQIRKNMRTKKVLYVKSGDFKFDKRFIRNLELYWQSKKGEYETAKYHREVTTPIEDAANKNGFYLKEIRNLRHFFSDINYYKADLCKIGDFVKEIKEFYEYKQTPFFKQVATTILKWGVFICEIIKTRVYKLFSGLKQLIGLIISGIKKIKSNIVEKNKGKDENREHFNVKSLLKTKLNKKICILFYIIYWCILAYGWYILFSIIFSSYSVGPACGLILYMLSRHVGLYCVNSRNYVQNELENILSCILLLIIFFLDCWILIYTKLLNEFLWVYFEFFIPPILEAFIFYSFHDEKKDW